jgi:hypothetical protein
VASAMSGDDRAQWLAELKRGDCVDCLGKHNQWRVAQIISGNDTHFRVHPLYWKTEDDEDVERTSHQLQPYGSRTTGRYTGWPQREKYVMIAPALPVLQAVPPHPKHPLQRFHFDLETVCVKCSKAVNKGRPAYSCLQCCYDLCTRCFVAAGGIDTDPLPCQPPAKQIQLENLQSVEFVDELKEHECAVCLSATWKPAVLPACGELRPVLHSAALQPRAVRSSISPYLVPPCAVPGHLFCSGCLSNVNPKTCPTCRKEFSLSNLHVCLRTERQIASKQVRCLNHAAGCQWTGELGADAKTLFDHAQGCGYSEFVCPRCEQPVRLADVQRHAREECLIRDNGGRPPSKIRSFLTEFGFPLGLLVVVGVIGLALRSTPPTAFPQDVAPSGWSWLFPRSAPPADRRWW